MIKIYADDPKVHYTATTVSPERTRDEISEVLRQYDTSLIAWNWKYNSNDELEYNNVWVQFQIEEIIDGYNAKITAKIFMPTIWNKAVRRSPDPKRRVESVNLKVSMRAMFWYIKANMENAYAMQSSRVAAFLSDMVTPNGNRFFDEMKQRLDTFSAIEDKTKPTPLDIKVIKPKIIDITNQYGE
jgi:hypothetical protein